MFCINLCWNHLLWAFPAGILWKTQPGVIFATVCTAKCKANCNHDRSLEDDYCAFLSSSWNLSSPHVTCSVCQSLQIFMKKFTSQAPFCEISWKNMHFCDLKKRLLFLMGRKQKLFSSGYYFPYCISCLRSSY